MKMNIITHYQCHLQPNNQSFDLVSHMHCDDSTPMIINHPTPLTPAAPRVLVIVRLHPANLAGEVRAQHVVEQLLGHLHIPELDLQRQADLGSRR